MDQAAQGKKALAESNYSKAIDHYTVALKSAPTSPDYLIQRSTALLRNKQYDESLIDAENAVVHAQSRGKKELIIEAQFRRGCALYQVKRFADAAFVFGLVEESDANHKQCRAWIQKTAMEMKKIPDDDDRRKVTVSRAPDLKSHSLATTTDTPKTETTSATKPAPAAPQQTPADKIRYEWYQSSDNVYFTLLAKGVPKDKAQIDIKQRSLSVSFPLANGASYDLTLDPLFAAVVPDKCSPRVMNTKVEVVLAKATSGQKWATLESEEQEVKKVESPKTTEEDGDAAKAASTSPAKPSGPAYPTSSKSGPKNWDKITKDLRTAENDGKEVGEDDDEVEGDEANHFFKKLFKNASPEMQRAMMKSYTESNGTALSTNWDEVSKGPVETHPPDGMEAKKWEG